jgi:hypothetical protein
MPNRPRHLDTSPRTHEHQAPQTIPRPAHKVVRPALPAGECADREPETNYRVDKDRGRSSRNQPDHTAHCRVFCQLGLNPPPTSLAAVSGIIGYGAPPSKMSGPPCAGAIDILRLATYIHRAADVGETLPVPRALLLLVPKPRENRDSKCFSRNDQAGTCCCLRFEAINVFRKLDSVLLFESSLQTWNSLASAECRLHFRPMHQPKAAWPYHAEFD